MRHQVPGKVAVHARSRQGFKRREDRSGCSFFLLLAIFATLSGNLILTVQTSTTLTGIVKAPQGDELLAKARLIADEATTNTDAKGNVTFNIQPSADLKGLPHRLPHS